MESSRRQGKISNFELFALVLNAMVGTGVFTVARSVAEVAGRGVIVSIPLAGLLSLAQLGGMYLLGRRFPDQTMPEYISEILGSILGKAYLLGYFLLGMSLAILISRNFWLLLNTWTLPTTPPVAFLLPLALVCWNAMRKGVIVLSRISLMLFTITIPIFMLMLLPAHVYDLDYVRPVLEQGIWKAILGMFPAFFSMVGFDIVLFVLPFTKRKHSFRAAGGAVSAATIFYTAITLLIITSLSLERMLIVTWPLQTYLNDITFTLIDRLDVVILILWTWQVIISVTIPMFMAGSCLRGVFPQLSSAAVAYVALFLISAALMLPIDMPQQQQLLTVYGYVALGYVGFLPFLLWLVALLRRKGGQGGEEASKKMA